MTVARSPAAQQIQESLRHERIMASAGSGKTFQLTNRYVSLIRAGAEPDTILASTFTRLAAGEIRDRVLTALATLAEDETERAKLEPFIGGPITRDEAIDMLEVMTTRLHRLQVRTLDSFFAAIVRAFALELGIDPAAEIVDEQIIDGLRQEAVRRMLDERDPQPLIDLLRALIDGMSDRSVTDAIKDVVKPLYDLYLEAPAEAWEAVQPISGLMDEAARVRAVEVLDVLANTVEDRSKIKGDYFNHKTIRKSFVADLDMMRRGNLNSLTIWMTSLGKGVASKIAADESVYNRRAIPDDVRAAYEPFVQHALALARMVVVHRTRATRDLIARFHEHFQSLKAAHRAMSFADLTHALARTDEFGSLDDIYFRLDATLQHLLLDEMQDTSIAQWRALEPMVREIASHEPPDRTFFCVGDVKQSIYGWRGAVPEILESIPLLLYGLPSEAGDEVMASRPLEKSYRSSPIIIDAVNELFESITSNPTLDDFADAAASWAQSFTHHTTAKTAEPGHVVLRTVREASARHGGDDEESQAAVRLSEAAELVAELHGRAPHLTIGILTRTNKSASHLLHLLRGLDVPASVRGGGALTDSPAVNVILDLLRLADHPAHTIAAFNVLHSPLGEAIGMTDLSDPPWRESDRAAKRLPAVAGRQWRNVGAMVRRQVLTNGYARTIAEWIAMIAPSVDARQRRRLILLQEQAANYDRHATLRCDDFVNYIESLDVADPFASTVQVMTVHQSKGLQFDTVVLPDLDCALVRTHGLRVLIERDGVAGPITGVARHVNKATTELFDDLSAMLAQHETQQARESLSLLYVAMTRAKHALHMLIDPPKRNNDGQLARSVSFAAVLREGLGACEPEPETMLYERGEGDWITKMSSDVARETERGEAARESEIDSIALARATGDVPRGQRGAAASALHEDESDVRVDLPRDLQERLSLPHWAARERGSAIHAMFEQVEWLDDGRRHGPADDVLRAAAVRAAPRRDQAWIDERLREFQAMLAQPAVRDALTRPHDSAGEVQLHNEFPFARIKDGAVQRGYIDRLVITIQNGAPVAARIIDFKTDDVSADAAAARAEQYRGQLETYRDIVRETFSLDAGAISMEVLFVAAGALVTLRE